MSAKKESGSTRMKPASTWKGSKVDEDFLPLDGAGFQRLLNQLLRAECFAAAVRPECLEVDLQSNRPDGGVDAFVSEAPASPTDHLKGPTVFQAKRSCPTRAEMKEELEKPRVRKLLKSGANYTLVTGAHVTAERQVLLTDLIKELYPRWTGRAAVLGAAQLLDWSRSHPSVWKYLPQGIRPPFGVEPYLEWTARLSKPVPLDDFVPSPDRTAVFQRVEQLQSGSGGWLHVEGSPGVGKTRCVFEALGSRKEAVAYCSGFSETLLEVPRETGGQLFNFLVVDECSIDQAMRLSIAFANTKLRLITIGAEMETAHVEPQRSAVRLEVLRGRALDQLASRLLGSSLDLAERSRLSQLSGGYPKLLLLLGQASERYPKDGDINQALLKLLGNERIEKRAFIALGLPRTFNAEELSVLARVVDRPIADLKEARDALLSRGLLGFVTERDSYVTPLLLGEILARQFWKDGDAFEGLARSASASLLRSCLSRLAQMGQTGATHLAQIGVNPLVDVLGKEQLVELLPNLAVAAPNEVLAAIRRLLPEVDDQKTLLPALQATLWFPETFAESAGILAAMEEGRDVLQGAFDAVLGATKADGDARAKLLTELARGTETERALAARCAERATQAEGGAFVSRSPESYELRWQPHSVEEDRRFRGNAVQVLGMLISDSSPSVRGEAQQIACQAVRALVRGGYVDAAAELLLLWARSGQPVAPLMVVLNTIDTHDHRFLQRASPEDRGRFESARREIRPRSVLDRLSLAAKPASWGEPNLEEIEKVARDAMLHNDLESIADWCFSEDAAVAVEIGEALAKHDPARLLLPKLVVRAKTARMARTAAAYVKVLADADQLVARWLTDSDLAPFCLEVLWLSGPTDRRVALMTQLVGLQSLRDRAFEQLLWGGWLLRANQALVRDFLERLRQRSTVSAFRLAFQCFFETEPRSVDSFWWAVPVSELGETQLTWEWSQLARSIGELEPERVGRALVQALERDDDRTPSEVVAVLSGLVQRAPRLIPLLLDLLEKRGLIDPETFYFLANGDSGELISWADSLDRARLVARLLPVSANGTLSRLLEKFDISDEMTSHFFSGSWVGPESQWLEGKRLQLIEFQKQELTPKMVRWVQHAIDLSEKMKARSERVEQAYDQGILPLPWVAES